MAVRYNDVLKNIILATVKTNVAGTLKLYPGTRPSTPDFPTVELPLVQFTLTYATAPSGGKLALSNTPVAAEILASGVAAWFRVETGTYKFDGIVTMEGAGGDIILTNTSLIQGEILALKKMDFSIL